MTQALVLLSGGLDSATTLAEAQEQQFACFAISFSYGQRHAVELEAAAEIARRFAVLEHRVVSIDLAAFGGSALTDPSIAVPTTPSDGIPITYVPARNTVFLSLALAWAEVLEVRDIFIGVNAVDYSGYPDCRQEFVAAFEVAANLGTKAGVQGDRIRIHTPLIELSKAQIIQRGLSLGVEYAATVSCYQPNARGEGCGECESCRLRREGYIQAGVPDPTRYIGR